jgi:hypothetical protein
MPFDWQVLRLAEWLVIEQQLCQQRLHIRALAAAELLR